MVLCTIVILVGNEVNIFVTDEFEDFMKLANVDDSMVRQVAKELEGGLHDGNLDMNKLFKKRIASPGKSKRDANRSVVALQKGDKIFFIAGWRKCDIPKKGKEIPIKLLEAYKLFGESLRQLTEEQIQTNILEGLLREVQND